MAVIVTRADDGSFVFSGRAFSQTKAKNEALAEFGCVVHDWGVTLALLPNEAQAEVIRQQIGNARFVRNRYLSDRSEYYKETKEILSPTVYKKTRLPELKEEFEFLKLSDKFALEAAIEHVDAAFRKFYKREAKFPRFASKQKPSGNRYTTKYTNNNIAVTEKDGRPCVKLPKAGLVPFVLPKRKALSDIVPEGTSILSCSVKKDSLGFTASFQLETVIKKPEAPGTVSVRDMLAADMGLKIFTTVAGDDGTQAVGNPRWIRLHARRLRRLQQSLSRKQYDQKKHKGSKNWEKTKRLVAKEQRKCASQRKDFQHKLSRSIADSCTAFVCEDLNIKGMVRNHHLAKEISSAGWGSFLTMVKYKMESAGKYFLRADRFFASSQTCSCCGYQNPEVKDLSVREWICPVCGAVHDRDENAAKNLLLAGARMLKEMGVTVVA